NVISNNNISGYTGTGVELLDSSDNLIDGNMIDNSAGENGVFLAGSDYNTIMDNDIFDSGAASSSSLSSQSIRSKVDGTQAFISRGIFLDPSNHNTIANNRISGYTGTGVELLDSSDNLIDGNMIDNSAGENGVFLAGSDYNSITNNDVWGLHTDNNPMSPSSQNIKYKISGVNAFISRGIFLDPSNYNIIINNTVSNITGTGVELLGSSDNLVDGNEISNNAEYGIFLQGSISTNVSHNVIYNDEFYGVSISNVSADNSISWNDFIGNNVGGTSQINDDGSGNQFSNNFLVDHDNTDYNNDSTSDNPYYIDGDAGSTDYTPNSLPVQPLKELGLALADLDAEVDYESETLNLKNEGNYETVKIKLPEGYSVTNINVSSIYTDGFIYAEEAQVQNPRTLIVKFSRPTLVSYLEWKLENETFPINVKLNVTGWLNGAFLKFYGYDIVKILNSDGTAAAIDQKLANPVEKPTQKFIDQIVETMIDASEQILIGQINGAQKPSGLTLSLLFAPMIAAVVVRRFYFVKKA
ncbi:MAG: nitrous oxide reductase family maturation protein NosD, partial [Promethearchaeota archaeon]